jgi:hypothetical protein
LLGRTLVLILRPAYAGEDVDAVRVDEALAVAGAAGGVEGDVVGAVVLAEAVYIS